MRRPLFSGIPIIATAADGPITLYDLTVLPPSIQQHTHFLTVFAVQNIAEVTSVLQFNLAGVALPDIDAPLKFGAGAVLERFPLRGDAKATVTISGGAPVLLFGFLELDGLSDTALNVRPLQPVPPSSPYTYTPVSASDASASVVHQIDASYLDLVTLRLFSEDGLVRLTLPGGTEISLQFDESKLVALFDQIPMRATASGQTNIAIRSLTAEPVIAYGTFNRHA